MSPLNIKINWVVEILDGSTLAGTQLARGTCIQGLVIDQKEGA